MPGDDRFHLFTKTSRDTAYHAPPVPKSRSHAFPGKTMVKASRHSRGAVNFPDAAVNPASLASDLSLGMVGAMTERPPEIPAATLVVFRNAQDGGPPELLMVTRSRAMSFAGGMAVFPGGRVDAADYALARRLCGPEHVDELAHRIAAIRETVEETGLLVGVRGAVDAAAAQALRTDLVAGRDFSEALEAAGLALDGDALVPFARWCPRGVTTHRIFDTRFYLADLGTGAVEVTVDATENTRLFWTSAREALAATDRGELSVIFPTRRNLERLALFDSFDEARAQAESIPVRLIVPEMAERDGRQALVIPDDLGYPVTSEPFESAQRG